MERSYGSRPHVHFEVEKVIGVSSDGSYQVQWAPAWVSKFHLVGCEHLIQEFLREQQQPIHQEQQQQSEKECCEGQMLTSSQNAADELDQVSQNEYAVHSAVSEIKTEESNKSNITGGFSQSHESPYSIQALPSPNSSPTFTVAIYDAEGLCGPAHQYMDQQKNSVETECVVANIQPYSSTPSNLMSDVEDTGIRSSDPPQEKYQMNSAVDVVKIEDTEEYDETIRTSSIPCSSSTNEATSFAEIDPSSSVHSCSETQHIFTDEHEEMVNTEHTTITGSTENLYTCEYCKNTFSDDSTLKQHYIFVHQLHVCHFCNKIFNQSSLLTQHLRLHHSKRRYQCSYCKTSFASSRSLKQHVCPGEQAFTCDLCGKSFAHRNVLDKHVLVHTGSKPYRCEVCGETFTQADAMYQHLAKHT